MYGTSTIGLPSAGVAGGGALLWGVHTSSLVLAVFAALMLLAMVWVLTRNSLRTAKDQRP